MAGSSAFPVASASSSASRSSRWRCIWFDLAGQLQRRRTRSGSSTPDRSSPPANFAGRIGAFIGRAVVPAARLRRLPHPARARRHRLALLLVPRRSTPPTPSSSARRCSSAASRRSCRWRSARSTSRGKEFRAGGYVGDRLAALLADVPEPHRLDHPDPDAALPRRSSSRRSSRSDGCSRSSARCCAIAGRRCSARYRARREERRRDKQRQEVLKKHLDKAAEGRARRRRTEDRDARLADPARSRRGRALDAAGRAPAAQPRRRRGGRRRSRRGPPRWSAPPPPR